METYYTKYGKKLGVAWSFMQCKDTRMQKEHKPHSHNPEYALYGPYMCPGYPEILMYDTPPRKPVNG